MLASEKQPAAEIVAKKSLKCRKLRNAEYYDMTETTDKLYAESQKGQTFTKLVELIATSENIKMAYRNIKRNKGSFTPGTDKITIEDIEKMSEDDYVQWILKKLAWYQPKLVRRKEIPKPNGKMRPLGIPCMGDRLVQQCVLQVLEPICEAKFYSRSNGFRPNRSAENAMAQCSQLINLSKLYYVVDVDIKGFFDNVDHCKLRQQMWNMGIRDKKLLCIISAMLEAPIVMPDESMVYPVKGTPQGGILSPLLANIVLNELDWWIASQWENMPTQTAYKEQRHKNGSLIGSNKYAALKKTSLKEMYIVRYADDFKIFCRKRSGANKVLIAVERWLKDRLNLDISVEKSGVTNLKKHYSEFLGFKLKVVAKDGKFVVRSHMADKAKKNVAAKLKNQVKALQKPKDQNEEYLAILRYNSMVMGVQNYYRIATMASIDFSRIARNVNITLRNRLGKRLSRRGTLQEGYVKRRYGKSGQLRYCNKHPIVPIGYVQHKKPMQLKRIVCPYIPEGRAEVHKDLELNMTILNALMRVGGINRSIEYTDNRISLWAAQYGKCAITGQELELDEIHCHHKVPKSNGGTDRYQNLVIVSETVHKLIHATQKETVETYLSLVKPNKIMLEKLNKYRKLAKLEPINR